jgi:hypothetical protein
MSTALEQLRTAGEQLRALFADERRAISTLDHAALEQITTTKVELARTLSTLRSQVTTKDPEIRELFETLRTEARATALLSTAANQTVRSMLGYKPANAYDRMARQQTASPGRVLARY